MWVWNLCSVKSTGSKPMEKKGPPVFTCLKESKTNRITPKHLSIVVSWNSKATLSFYHFEKDYFRMCFCFPCSSDHISVFQYDWQDYCSSLVSLISFLLVSMVSGRAKSLKRRKGEARRMTEHLCFLHTLPANPFCLILKCPDDRFQHSAMALIYSKQGIHENFSVTESFLG